MKNILLLFLFGLIVCSGCQNGTSYKTKVESVDGLVLLDGAPVGKATITFYPADDSGELASGMSDAQGKFTVNSLYGPPGQGAKAGAYKVMISQLEITTIPHPSGDPTLAETKSKELLPAVYQDKVKTPLTAEIKNGKNSIKLELIKK